MATNIKTEYFDKIRILVIDDQPKGLVDPKNNLFTLPQKYAVFFDIRWLATPEECRDFRDMSLTIIRKDQYLLTEIGWVPEILALDYALTTDLAMVKDRISNKKSELEKISPLPSLHQNLKNFPYKAFKNTDGWSPTVLDRENDAYGCYIGGLILSTFSDHPCGLVTITRYGEDGLKDLNPDAYFFEWFMSQQTSGMLKANKTSAEPQWDDILKPGIKNFRDQIVSLAKADILTVNPNDLLAMLDKNTAHDFLTIVSRFGRRQLPIKGLFIDDVENYINNASVWAENLLKDILLTNNSSIKEFRDGEKLAKELWAHYNNIKLVEMRHLLSTLALKLKKAPQKILTEVEKDAASYFGVNIDKGKIKSKKCTQNSIDIQSANYSQRSKRWAALIIILKVLNRRWEAAKEWKEKIAPNNNKSPLSKPVTVDDIHLALFPLAEAPLILPWDEGKNATAFWKTLSRLGGITSTNGPKNKYGFFALSVEDLLDGHDWTDNPQKPNGMGKHGFLPGERILMKWLANDLYGKESWSNDDQVKRMLVSQENSDENN